MEKKLLVYNSLTRKKEVFEPLNPPFVGMYVCGPTVYGDPHLGHARAAIVFDVVYRYLQYLGYKVRYVSNITDVGHLENDSDEGEDKIAKKARLEQLEPMEIAQKYTIRYQDAVRMLNVLPPSIQPRATGHIPEQLEFVEKILNSGYAYEVNGSVYFDVEKYNKKYHYGKLSGRRLEELYEGTRELEGQSEKKHPFDFALWKKADPKHIMKWKSPWSEGFPGWHLECSVMSTKYLGEQFDIHGGGMDLQFPHHECEIAQSVAAYGKEPVKYWMHNNLITINGQKMSKSLNNFITLFELFEGKSDLLEKAYSPMTVRFFILQAHYRSPLDFSNEALKSAEKGFKRLMKGIDTLNKIKPSETTTFDIDKIYNNVFAALNDDFNTPVALAHLFEGIKKINSVYDGKEKITEQDLNKLKQLYNDVVFNILGIKMKQYIKDQVKKSYETKQAIYANEALLNIIEVVAHECVKLYKDTSNKTILAGNGGSAADAQHIAAELVGRYGFDRPSIPSLALTTDSSNLTAIGNDYGYDKVFSRQLEGMGQSGDIFFGISTSGNSLNIINAFESAKQKNIMTVALVGRDGGKMAKIADYAIIVPSDSTPRIQESHILIGHILCDIIEKEIFGNGVSI